MMVSRDPFYPFAKKPHTAVLYGILEDLGGLDAVGRACDVRGDHIRIEAFDTLKHYTATAVEINVDDHRIYSYNVNSGRQVQYELLDPQCFEKLYKDVQDWLEGERFQ